MFITNLKSRKYFWRWARRCGELWSWWLARWPRYILSSGRSCEQIKSVKITQSSGKTLNIKIRLWKISSIQSWVRNIDIISGRNVRILKWCQRQSSRRIPNWKCHDLDDQDQRARNVSDYLGWKVVPGASWLVMISSPLHLAADVLIQKLVAMKIWMITISGNDDDDDEIHDWTNIEDQWSYIAHDVHSQFHHLRSSPYHICDISHSLNAKMGI